MKEEWSDIVLRTHSTNKNSTLIILMRFTGKETNRVIFTLRRLNLKTDHYSRQIPRGIFHF